MPAAGQSGAGKAKEIEEEGIRGDAGQLRQLLPHSLKGHFACTRLDPAFFFFFPSILASQLKTA